jgi:hypothetical protein
MIDHEKTMLTFKMPLYLHEEVGYRAKAAKRCKTSELVARLQASLVVHPVSSVSFKEAAQLKLLLDSKDFSKKGRIAVSSTLHQQLKKASIKTGQSIGLEFSCRIQKSIRDDSHNYIN